MPQSFQGFCPESLKFLKTVREKNSKEWFERHRNRYLDYILTPFQDLVADLTDTMLSIDPHFETRPAINKTITKIYRDTRFSRDKSLFKERMWLVFKGPVKDWKDSPTYFFELAPDWYRFGLGYYSASRETMNRLRESINDNPSKFLKVISFYKNQRRIKLHPDKYKRIIPNKHPDEIQDWYQCKSFYLSHNRKIDRLLFSPKLVSEIKKDFLTMKLLYQYLIEFNK